MAGIALGQFVLFGPSFLGSKYLLPLDILQQPSFYLPAGPDAATFYPEDPIYMDKLAQFEPDRRFAVGEFKAGRFPLWMPQQYGGVPFIWPKYSPFSLVSCLTESPYALTWSQMLAALVAGLGAYGFCRRTLTVSFWPSAIVAWCYPLTGFFIFWQGFATCAAAYWLPWLLLAVDRLVAGARFAAPGLALVTGLALVSGHIDVAGQVLLVSGLFALWRLGETYFAQRDGRRLARPAAHLALSWALGFLLAAPHIMPLVEYAQTGYRMLRRSSGTEERPPVGPAALPQVVLPDMYGSTQRGACPLFQQATPNLPESAAATYAGLLATLLVAPWAWCSRRHRSLNAFWAALIVFGLSWCANLPGFVQLLRLPGLNFMSHNRLPFAASFAILALVAVGLENLRAGAVTWRRGFWLPGLLLAALLGWCAYRSVVFPASVTARLERALKASGNVNWITKPEQFRIGEDWLRKTYRAGAILCGVGLLGWIALCSRRVPHRVLLPTTGALLIGDLLWFGYGRVPQGEPAQYFPEIPALRALQAGHDRVIGYDCLPAKLANVVGLRDVRGYDSVDPSQWMAILVAAADSYTVYADYAVSQWLKPKVKIAPPNGLDLPPVLDMLAVRHVIFRGTPPQGIQPAFQSHDYWVLENTNALDRVFVPRTVLAVMDDEDRFRKLGAADFDPRQVAFVETPVNLPPDCQGRVQIARETPGRIEIRGQMATPGLVVLADMWDKGWRAELDGQPALILRVNHALRGVVVPAGGVTLDLRYESSTVRIAAVLALVGLGACVCWFVRDWPGRTRQPHPEGGKLPP